MISTIQTRRWSTPAVVGVGLVALAGRVPSAWAVLVTAAVGSLGAMVPVEEPAGESHPRLPLPLVVTLGTVPFFVAATWMRPSFAGAGALALIAGVIAAVAEELFFRRLVFGWLSSRGSGVAIVGSAALFAVVHAPAYGLAVVPIDFAAGLIFGWQRRAWGSWQAPALTHCIANILAAM